MELPNGWLWPGGKDGIGPKGVRVSGLREKC